MEGGGQHESYALFPSHCREEVPGEFGSPAGEKEKKKKNFFWSRVTPGAFGSPPVISGLPR